MSGMTEEKETHEGEEEGQEETRCDFGSINAAEDETSEDNRRDSPPWEPLPRRKTKRVSRKFEMPSDTVDADGNSKDINATEEPPWEKVRSCRKPKPGHRWKKFTEQLDSGAAKSAAPKGAAPEIPIQETEEARTGKLHKAADRSPIKVNGDKKVVGIY
jgi:hypothetical protein